MLSKIPSANSAVIPIRDIYKYTREQLTEPGLYVPCPFGGHYETAIGLVIFVEVPNLPQTL
jgi:hypothetical protein